MEHGFKRRLQLVWSTGLHLMRSRRAVVLSMGRGRSGRSRRDSTTLVPSSFSKQNWQGGVLLLSATHVQLWLHLDEVYRVMGHHAVRGIQPLAVSPPRRLINLILLLTEIALSESSDVIFATSTAEDPYHALTQRNRFPVCATHSNVTLISFT